ncbi:cytochrome P450 monooxygenase [Cryphonectria parasitica EP155]|uniref:Cytochrome P450 monooxygenase n=1 Tax=Cryphonectria parasitica (strain ATCC 38755 / EP155) TaxID=660469 RepID=A0A9P4XWU2_CRYP1|nr:cytochrome P450 monooxygenase [Cryphonectria parasitica EP155]KAF3762478.1 cytochrome P450 monooxygenase [Cryphonectria parasitica EP155]
MSSLLTTTSWAAFVWLGVGFLILSYNLSALYTWNRLRAIPAASWTAHFSYLWLARNTYSGRQYWIHRDLHKRHGPLVRVGPNQLVTNEPDVVKMISGTNSSWVRDSSYITGRLNPYYDNLFSLLDPKEHNLAKSRTIAAYSGRETPDLEIGVDSQVKTLIDTIRTRCATPSADSPVPPLLDLGTTSCYFTMDVITRLAFGSAFGYLRDNKDHHNFLGSIRELWPRMSACADVPWIRNFLFSRPFLKLMGPKPTDKSGFGALMGVASHYVGERFASTAKPRQDMLGSMMKHGLNQTECETEGLFMIFAGTESTASAIRSALVHTMTSPVAYQTLKEEIHTAVREGKVSSPITLQEAKKLPYLQASAAVVYEGIRMRPPLIGLLPKVVPPGGENILGYQIPAGTAIGTNASSILASTDLFGPDANIFRPERFTELDDQHRKQMERNVELAFGHGQWMCVGKTIALLEINKSVFELFRAFDLQLLEPYAPSNILSYGVFLESNLKVKVSRSTTAVAASSPDSVHI